MTAPVVRPRALRFGDVVSIVSPSAAGAPIAPQRYERAVAWLSRYFRVRSGALTWETERSRRGADPRAAELNEAIRDPQVRAVVACIGGLTSNAVLRLLDFEAFAADPKPVIGYSDITAVLLALHTRTGVVTFHGPTVMPEFGEWPEPFPFTVECFLAAVTRTAPVGPVPSCRCVTDEFLAWGHADDRPRQVAPGRPRSWVVPGQGSGRLWGGNLDTITGLLGTPFIAAEAGRLLFWETTAVTLDPVESRLTQLADAGLLDGLTGMIVGRPFRAAPGFAADLAELVAETFAGQGYPVVTDVDIGHGDPMVTLPMGVQAQLDSESDAIVITEPAVQD